MGRPGERRSLDGAESDGRHVMDDGIFIALHTGIPSSGWRALGSRVARGQVRGIFPLRGFSVLLEFIHFAFASFILSAARRNFLVVSRFTGRTRASTSTHVSQLPQERRDFFTFGIAIGIE